MTTPDGFHDDDDNRPMCQICDKPADCLRRYYDRYNIYSGLACSDRCARQLPGQGEMWDYEAQEDVEGDLAADEESETLLDSLFGRDL